MVLTASTAPPMMGRDVTVLRKMRRWFSFMMAFPHSCS
jgi:hypothetical protein